MERILVVEDELTLMTDLVDYLDAKGYCAIGADTMEKARNLINSSSFNCAIIDIGLPDGDGTDLIEEIRRKGWQCGVLMLTAYGQPDSRVACLGKGADAYLVKKATLREVEATVQSILRRLPGDTGATREISSTSWVLNASTLTLTPPDDSAILLNNAETVFIRTLARANGKICRRTTVEKELEDSCGIKAKSINQMIMRLKEKIRKKTSSDFSINVVYGSGFSLAVHVEVID